MLGGYLDFLVHVSVSDNAHLSYLGFNQITAINHVNQVKTALIFKHLRSQPYRVFDTKFTTLGFAFWKMRRNRFAYTIPPHYRFVK